jgi:hypothetical protein
MAKGLLIKIDHPGSPRLIGATKREQFWHALSLRAGEKQEEFESRKPTSQTDPQKSEPQTTLFWAQAKQIAEYRGGLRDSIVDPPYPMYRFDPDEFERQLKINFPNSLREYLINKLNHKGDSDFDLYLAIVNIGYGSLELLLAAIGLEKASALSGITMPIILSMIDAGIPEALQQSLALPSGMNFNVAVSEEVESPSSPSTQSEGASSSRIAASIATTQDTLSRLLRSYLGPILLGVAVLYFAATSALDALRGASTERLGIMHDYADLTKQQLTALSDERKAFGAERSAMVQAFSDLTKQQIAALSDERKDITKIAAALLHDANADRESLVGALQKVTTDEHVQSLDLLKPTIDKAREASSGAAALRAKQNGK